MEIREVKKLIELEGAKLLIENRNLRQSLAEVGINLPTEQERVELYEGLADAFGFPAIEKRKGNREERARRKAARLAMGKGRPFVNHALSTQHYNGSAA